MRLFFLIFLFPSLLFAQNTDIELLREININRNTKLDSYMKFASNSVSTVTFGVPIAMFGCAIITKDSATLHKAIMVSASIVTTSIISTVLKNTIKRERPFNTYPELIKLSSGGSYSFPSGHTSDAFSTATSLSLAYPKWYVIAPAFLWASSVGYSRMHLGVHYPSDVLVGAIVGSGSAYLCYKIQKCINKKRRNGTN